MSSESIRIGDARNAANKALAYKPHPGDIGERLVAI
jgi:hypothetical protein